LKSWRLALVLSLAGLVASLLLIRASPFGRQLATGAAVAAKQMCSLVFVSGLPVGRARALYVDPMLRGAGSILRFDVRVASGAVVVTLPGITRQRALHRPGYGCTLQHAGQAAMEDPPPAPATSPDLRLDTAHRDAVFDRGALEAAVEGAFVQDPAGDALNTLAVVVLHAGKLVAERYADGITPETKLPGWSMTKSVTATLAGVLVQHGLIEMHEPGAIREWRGTRDPRAAITLDHLLRMTSGLLLTEAGETGSGLDPTTRMLYQEPDAAAFAARQPLARDVGSHFEYMSGSTVLAMRALQDAVGGDLHDAHEFFHANLFEPLDMQGAVLEADQAGTFLGSTHMLASARDWARFGQLYVDAGMAKGRRIVPENWLDIVTTPTPQSGAARRGDVFWEPGRSAYGAGFWLLGEEPLNAAAGALPPDSFDANGFQGQYTHVIPSEQLVTVRLGATHFRGHDHERLPREVLQAKRRQR
jgi:CubicO group peptidase (beta-lactamase class C family)